MAKSFGRVELSSPLDNNSLWNRFNLFSQSLALGRSESNDWLNHSPNHWADQNWIKRIHPPCLVVGSPSNLEGESFYRHSSLSWMAFDCALTSNPIISVTCHSKRAHIEFGRCAADILCMIVEDSEGRCKCDSIPSALLRKVQILILIKIP